MKSILMVAFAILLLFGSMHMQAADVPEQFRSGSYCLAVTIKTLAPDVTLEQIEAVLGEPGSRGYSLLQLDETAKKFGFKTAMSQTNLDQIRYRKNKIGERFVCLTFVKDDHFVLFYDLDDSRVRICDPPMLSEFDIPVFEKFWSGKVLFISNQEMLTEEEVLRSRKLRTRGTYFMVFIVSVVAIFLLAITIGKRRKTVSQVLLLAMLFMISTICGCTTATETNDRSVDSSGGTLKIESKRDIPGNIMSGTCKTIRVDSKVQNTKPANLKKQSFITKCDCTNTWIDTLGLIHDGTATLSTALKLGETAVRRTSPIEIRSPDREQPAHSAFFDRNRYFRFGGDPDSSIACHRDMRNGNI